MSWLGTMMGEPLAGCRMLLVDIISTRASSCASSESGTCTAIWSPSKSALKAAQTSGLKLDRLAFDQHRLERLDAEAVQRRRAVEQHRMLANHLVENVPDLGLLLLDQLLRLLHRGGQALGVEPRIDERLEQLERHLLRQAALVQLELGTDHDHRAARIVDRACRAGSGGTGPACP